MSKYTTKVRYICETLAGETSSQQGNEVNDIVMKAFPLIFESQIPVFNENYRATLFTKILRHYYTREIGFETYGLWRLHLNNKMYEIMPYYNQLYASAELEFEPLGNYDLTRTLTRTGTDDTTTNGTNNETLDNTLTQTTKQGFSRSPQGTLANVETNAYLSEATVDTFTASSDSSRDTTTNETKDRDYNESVTETIKGKNSGISNAEILQQYRQTFLNIDLQIINELEPLFFSLWQVFNLDNKISPLFSPCAYSGVLPQEYTQALSYQEQIYRLVYTMNQIINVINGGIDSALEQYIEQHFADIVGSWAYNAETKSIVLSIKE